MPDDTRRRSAFFHVSVLPDPAGTVLLTADDDLDSAGAAEASAHATTVLTAAPTAVVVDLAGRFLDAAGIRALLGITLAATVAGVPLRIIGWPEWLPALAHRLAVEELALCPDLSTALAGVRAERWRTRAGTRRGDLSAPGAA
jgi:hypothetical protein